MNPFVLIVGPTASGKSALALSLAQKMGAGILNCDSLQTYQRLDIGTAKPGVVERSVVPHYMFDEVEPGKVLTAGDFRRLALEVLQRELPSRMIFGVGGSGFYIQALEKGMFDLEKPKVEIDLAVRKELETKGLPALYAELQSLDPDYAEDLNPNDSYRISRAVVIIRDTGKTVTELRRQFTPKKFPFPLLKLGLAPSREQLLPKVIQRTKVMLEAGFLREVESLLHDGWSEWPPMQSVGYRECVLVLKGELPSDQLAAVICEKTMQLAKKQKTWFKRDAEIHWLNPDDPEPQATRLIMDFQAGLR